MILAIDPGPRESAFCLWDGERIIGANKILNEYVFTQIVNAGEGALVAVEHLQCFGMAVGASVFETAYWVGEYRSFCKLKSVEFARVFRSEVKMHFCHSMRAKDANISQALRDRFGGKGTKKSPGLTYGLKADMWSAFAIAVMTHDKREGAGLLKADAPGPPKKFSLTNDLT